MTSLIVLLTMVFTSALQTRSIDPMLPVIAAEGVGAAAELIRPGVNGDVFVNGDVGQLAAQLLNLSFCETPQAARAAACRATADHWHYRHSINRLVQALTPC